MYKAMFTGPTKAQQIQLDRQKKVQEVYMDWAADYYTIMGETPDQETCKIAYGIIEMEIMDTGHTVIEEVLNNA